LLKQDFLIARKLTKCLTAGCVWAMARWVKSLMGDGSCER